MTYWEDVRAVAEAHIDEIEADLRSEQRELQAARAAAEEQAGRVAALQALVALVRTSGREAPVDGRLTLHAAMAEVLSSAPMRMMRAADLADAIRRRGLYAMRDGRPAEPQQVHARVGHYPALFEREGTFIKLRDEE
jgi:hypothetical protein